MIISKTFLFVHHLATGQVELECDGETAAVLQGMLSRARPRGVESFGTLTVRVSSEGRAGVKPPDPITPYAWERDVEK